MTTADYIHNRKDGGTTHCYGDIVWDSSFFIACENENDDGFVEDLDGSECDTWEKVCVWLEDNDLNKVEQVEVD
tara:strand:+ start:25 stop:246 length:222 start_codon:yes stop_codon:yes gene_type:complete